MIMYVLQMFIANNLLPILTIIGQIIILVLIISGLLQKRCILSRWLINNNLLAAFLISLIATLGSLFYSEILHYQPCKLCWFQRIFMYPQVILLGLAVWHKDLNIKKYSLSLSVIGLLIAAYHYLMQIGWIIAINCGAVGYSVSCTETFILQYGYITIPMMSLTAFGLMALLMTSKTPNKT